MTGVTELVREVDSQNETIARTTAAIGTRVDRVRTVVESFGAAAERSEVELGQANEKVGSLEIVACDMFDQVVRAGLSPADSLMVEVTQRFARDLEAATEAALASGALSADALFDRNYVPIEGSNPPRFQTRLFDWAQANWRPWLDKACSADPRIVAAVCKDVGGYLPTHPTETSREPTGDFTHDKRFTRHGRRFDTGINRRAAASQAPWLMAVYRREADGTDYAVVYSVFVPVHFAGRRWGDFQISYLQERVGDFCPVPQA